MCAYRADRIAKRVRARARAAAPYAKTTPPLRAQPTRFFPSPVKIAQDDASLPPSPSPSASPPLSPTPTPLQKSKGDEYSTEDLFALMDQAKQIEVQKEPGSGDCGADSRADETGEASLWEHERRRPVVILLSDGTWHSCCPGQYCPHTERNGEGQFVCRYTGVLHDIDIEGSSEWYDLNGGTGSRADDADNRNGNSYNITVVRHARTVTRHDPVRKSQQAYARAMVLDDEFENQQWKEHMAMQAQPTTARGARPSGRRRVALCVDVDPCASKTGGDAASADSSSVCAAHGHAGATAGAVHEADRYRFTVRNPHFQGPPEQLGGLINEVQLVLHRLIHYREAASYKQPAKAGTFCAHVEAGAQKPRDEHAEWMASVRKYIKECLVRGVAPSLDTVHNLGLMAHAAKAVAASELVAQQKAAAVRTVRFREVCSNLVVQLWRACCSTTYLRNAKRGADSFRPFVCGVLYAFKRGLVLANGSVLVPQCPLLAAALPVLGSTGGNNLAKILHSSSHRGMSTLLKCIASVPPENQNALFAKVVSCAAQFAATRFAATDL